MKSRIKPIGKHKKSHAIFLLSCLFLSLPALTKQVNPCHASPMISVDLLVYESTPSSIMAAVAAANEGLSVAMLSPYKHVGGMRTSGLAMHNLGIKETFGGLGKEFHDQVYNYYVEKYGENSPQVKSSDDGFRFEPHVAEKIFLRWLLEAGVILLTEEHITDVVKEGSKITRVITSSNRSITAKVFIDGSYEGDLLAKAGITYRVGRDSRDDFNESMAGLTYPASRAGEASDKIQRYVYRLALTDSVENQLPITKPRNYHRSMFMIDAAQFEHKPPKRLRNVLTLNGLPNRKTDVRVGEGWVGGSNGWVSANHKERKYIANEHKEYAQGYLWFLLTDRSVPAHVKSELKKWGLAKDEFVDNDNWPYQLYVREARRMMGEYVMTESDILTHRFKEDGIAIGSYMLDVHPTQYVPLEEGDHGLYSASGVVREGGVAHAIKPYEIPYRSILPKKVEAENLFVTVCVSASHIAFSSIRMEPVYMMMGHAAGIASAMSVKSNTPIHNIDSKSLREELIQQKAVLDASVFDSYGKR